MGERKVKIAYICDGLDRCSDKIGCFRHATPGMDACKHTWNPRHALNGKIKKPEKYPDRFHALDIPEEDPETIVYWEGDIDLPV